MTRRALLLALGLFATAGPACADDRLAKATKILNDSRADKSLRARAAKLIGQTPSADAAAVTALCRGAMAKSDEVRSASFDALEAVAPALRPHVMTLVMDNTHDNHAAALAALAEMGTAAAAAEPVVAQHVRTFAAESVGAADANPSLSALGSSALVIPNIERLASRPIDLAGGLASTQRGRSMASTRAALLAACGAVALGRIACQDEAVPARSFEQLLKHPNNLVRYSALVGVDLFGKKAAKCQKAVDALKTDRHKHVRELAFKVSADIRNGTPGRAVRVEEGDVPARKGRGR